VIKVLVVDDSPVVREFLTHILESDPGIRVIGTAGDGAEAIEAVMEKKPDVVTMDFHMPKMNGYEATRAIMETNPVAVIIVSGSLDPREVTTSFRALEAGALAIVVRPSGIGYPDHENSAKELIRYVKAMAGVPLVRRWPRASRAKKVIPPLENVISRETPAVRLVAIGASTGGPILIQRILATLPRDFPVPVLVVQHMAAGFIAGFAAWLAQSAGINAKVAQQGEPVCPGCIYVAPDGYNMGVDKNGWITLSTGDSHNGHCPSVSHLFRSVAEAYGEAAVGILLSGMGKDGAQELLLMKERGAVTIAQDEASSIVFGMPGAAVSLNAATLVLSPDAIAEMLKVLVNKGGGAGKAVTSPAQRYDHG
jgi:two-component system chemotaxis response regulator CheB